MLRKLRFSELAWLSKLMHLWKWWDSFNQLWSKRPTKWAFLNVICSQWHVKSKLTLFSNCIRHLHCWVGTKSLNGTRIVCLTIRIQSEKRLKISARRLLILFRTISLITSTLIDQAMMKPNATFSKWKPTIKDISVKSPISIWKTS